MEKINFEDGITKGNAKTFNQLQTNVENAINDKGINVKRVNTFLKSGESYVDEDIKKCQMVVIHYSIQESGYLKSAVVQVGLGTWYWDCDPRTGFIIYFKIDWTTGTISLSDGTTVSHVIGVVGYDLIM